jgi:phenylacetate-coenzyme A ligase PaaK-like adenylate-forming protein
MLEEILDIHFNPDTGTPYWLDILQQKGLQRHDFQNLAGLHQLGAMDVEAMRCRPITDFIPRNFHGRMGEMILAETGGTTGDPCRRVYLPDEFHAAFVAPWMQAVDHFHFPKKQTWLFIGPSGPHIIAQAARALARGTNSLEPFSIDCDVRWIKQQQPDSMGHMLYMDHLLQQAMNIIDQQQITVLFTTPPLLLALADKMKKEQRQQIAGIHTGGLAPTTEVSRQLAAFFPAAVILPGYGNSLFGVAFEKEQIVNESSTFFVHDPNLHLHLIPLPADELEAPHLTETVAEGERGRVMFHRFDRSFLLLNMLERDTAVRIIHDGTECLKDIEGLCFQQEKQSGVY